MTYFLLVYFILFSLHKTWEKKQCISEKMALLKVLFIKIKNPLILIK